MGKKTCYMCDAKATSTEHVPPKCLFPEQVTFGRDLRKNLITVPSCDAHNLVKSDDDNFLRMVLTTLMGNNAVGQHQFVDKTLSGVRQFPGAYKSFFQNPTDVFLPPGKAFQIDRARLDRCCDHIARALMFHVHAVKWPDPLEIYTPSLFMDVKLGVPVRHELTDKVVALLRDYLTPAPVQGANQEAFRYRLRYDAGERAFALAAQFYHAFEFFAFSPREEMAEAGSQPATT
jgi:hypothetical protein